MSTLRRPIHRYGSSGSDRDSIVTAVIRRGTVCRRDCDGLIILLSHRRRIGHCDRLVESDGGAELGLQFALKFADDGTQGVGRARGQSCWKRCRKRQARNRHSRVTQSHDGWEVERVVFGGCSSRGG